MRLLNVLKLLCIPWFQAELDGYVEINNSNQKQAQPNKILPLGPPNDIEEHPENYSAMNFKVCERFQLGFLNN